MAGKSGFGIGIAHDVETWRKKLQAMGRDQIPFAMAVAMTRTAQNARDVNRRYLPRAFRGLSKKSLRSRIKITRAEKRDWPKLRASVNWGETGKDDFWLLQETGGFKRGKGGGRVAIPTSAVKRTKGGRVRASQKPRAISKRASGKEIAGQLRAKPGRKKSAPLLTFYNLRNRAKIKPTLRGREITERTADKKLPQHYDRELTAAVKSARVRKGSFSAAAARVLYFEALKKAGGPA